MEIIIGIGIGIYAGYKIGQFVGRVSTRLSLARRVFRAF